MAEWEWAWQAWDQLGEGEHGADVMLKQADPLLGLSWAAGMGEPDWARAAPSLHHSHGCLSSAFWARAPNRCYCWEGEFTLWLLSVLVLHPTPVTAAVCAEVMKLPAVIGNVQLFPLLCELFGLHCFSSSGRYLRLLMQQVADHKKPVNFAASLSPLTQQMHSPGTFQSLLPRCAKIVNW